MATSSKLPEGLYMFEQSFLRAPNETLRRHFRATQKLVERDMSALKNTARDAVKKAGTQTAVDAIAVLDGMIAKVEGLQKKVQDVHDKGTAPTLATMRKRLDHLEVLDKLEPLDEAAEVRTEVQEIKMEEKEVSLDKPVSRKSVYVKAEKEMDMDLQAWTDVRLDRWLVDWCLRNKLYDTAHVIARERNIEDLVDLTIFAEIRRIEEALSRHSCTEALAWCSDNKNALRKNKSTLEFELRLQEYVELNRAEKTLEAIAYWKKHLSSWQDTQLARMQQVAPLIVMSPKTKSKVYQRFYSPERYEQLIKAFRHAIYNLHSLPNLPLLHYAISAGLTALKLPACMPVGSAGNQTEAISESTATRQSAMQPSSTIDSASSISTPPFSDERSSVPSRISNNPNPDCPVCDQSCLGVLAPEVPFSHHANSIIVCRISGEIMNADNPPLAFENGMVYSKKALQDMAMKNNGFVKCPRTGVEAPLEMLRKVFVS